MPGVLQPVIVVLGAAAALAVSGTAPPPGPVASLVFSTALRDPVVLFDGRFVDGFCVADRTLGVTGIVSGVPLGILSDGPDGCVREVVVFSRDRGAAARRWPKFAPQTGRLVPALYVPPRKRPVYLALWWRAAVVNGTRSELEPWDLRVAVGQAEVALMRARAGVQLVVRSRHPLSGAAGEALASASCLTARAAADRPGFDPGAVNVFWVPTVGPMDFQGYSCGNVGAQNQVYVYSTAQPGALAHELGHTLGLSAPEPGAVGADTPEPYPDDLDWGHTSGLPCPPGVDDGLCSPLPCQPGVDDGFCFTKYNIMWDGVVQARNISLGQVFRMNFDARSWLNRPGFSGPFVRVCQSDPVLITAFCPRLGLRSPGGQP